MKRLGKVRRSLGDESYRRKLAFLGSAAVVVIGAGFYLHVAASSAATVLEVTPDVVQVYGGSDASFRAEVDTDGNFNGTNTVKNINIACTGTANVSSVVHADGNISGSNTVEGVTITGNQDRKCAAARIAVESIAK